MKWLWLFLVSSSILLLVVIAEVSSRPDYWFSGFPFASAEVVDETSVTYHDDKEGLVWINYGDQEQKCAAVRKWRDDFPDRWNRQIWADAEDGVLIITYVP